MKAAVIVKPGVIEVRDVPTPSPASGEVLLKVDMAALCGTDQRVLRGEKDVDVAIVGHELAGTVVSVGEGVTGVKAGERYAVQTVIGCNDCSMCVAGRQNLCENGFKAIGYAWNGAFAEYMTIPKAGVDQGCLIPLPDGMSDDLGTLIEPLSCCVNGMRYLPCETMKHVLILGAGIIGVLNGLVAKARGAGCVTLMDPMQKRLDMLERMELGIDHFVNNRVTDPLEWVKDHTGGRGVDGVVVAASVKQLASQGLKLLARGGHLSVFAGMSKQDPVEAMDLNRIHYLELNVHGANSSVRRDYIEARDLLQSGKVPGRKLVTHTFPLVDFNAAFAAQADPEVDSLKVLIQP